MSNHAVLTVLVIDDNPGSLELLSSALAGPGIEVLTASDPAEGIDLVAQRRPQIVLTDLVMPGMNGLEVLGRVLEIDPATDVILMTAHYSTETAVEAIKKGASDYLNKPVSVSLIREKIRKLQEDAEKRQKALQLQDELLHPRLPVRKVRGVPERPFDRAGDTRHFRQERRRGEADQKDADDHHREQAQNRADPLDPPPALSRRVEKDRVLGHVTGMRTAERAVVIPVSQNPRDVPTYQ